MPCTTAATPCERYKARLLEAEDALHALRLGRSTELVQHDGKVVKFSPANLSVLQRYVEDLQCKVDRCNGINGSGRRRFIGMIPR